MGFLVSVKGGRAPSFVHDSVDSAVIEGMRLQRSIAAQRGGTAPEVSVLQEVLTLPFRSVGVASQYPMKIQDYSCKVSVGTLMNVVSYLGSPLTL